MRRVVKFGVRHDSWRGDGDGWAMAHQRRTYGRKIFRPYKCGEWLHRVCAMICGAAMVMVGRLRINGARRGEKYFARTSVVRRRVAGATIWGALMFDGWAMAHQSRTCGRKIFRPYTCGAWLHWAGAMIYVVAMVMVG